jgi:hypothetical protein
MEPKPDYEEKYRRFFKDVMLDREQVTKASRIHKKS